MRKNIRSSSSPKALAASFPMPTLADALDEVRLSVDRFCLLAGVEALCEMMEADTTTVCGLDIDADTGAQMGNPGLRSLSFRDLQIESPSIHHINH